MRKGGMWRRTYLSITGNGLRYSAKKKSTNFLNIASVDHGSNREPCGSVRGTNRTVPHPTVRFVSETEPRRHGSVCGGHKPWRFVHGLPMVASFTTLHCSSIRSHPASSLYFTSSMKMLAIFH